MSRELQLTFRSDDGDFVDSTGESDIRRIMDLAGIVMKQPEAGSDQGCESCGDQSHEATQCPHSAYDETHGLDEEQAEYDYGNQDNDPEGHEIDQDTYVWNASKLPQRIVKGTQGDNPLISEIHNKLLEQYMSFIAEGEDRENEDGTLSPLSDPTKPEFDKDPLSAEKPVDDGSHSPMSTIARQAALK
jgi:hypothetical protein